MQNGVPTLESNLMDPHNLTHHPTPGYLSMRNENTRLHKNLYTFEFKKIESPPLSNGWPGIIGMCVWPYS